MAEDYLQVNILASLQELEFVLHTELGSCLTTLPQIT